METETQVSTETTAAPEAAVATPVSQPQATPTVSDKIEAIAQKGAKGSKSSEPSNNQKAAANEVAKAAGEPLPYSPSYKFKSYDREFEFDEWVRPVIKDKEMEEKVRDLYTKAYSMDILKPKYQETRDKYQDVNNKYTTINKNLQMLEGYLDKGDMTSFLSTLKIPDNMVYQYVLDKLQYKEMAPDQRAQIDKFNQTQQHARMLESQNQEYQQKFENEALQLRTFQLDSAISRPDIKSIADAYDARKGTAGAFRERVVREGMHHWNATGKDLTPEEAVKEVMDTLDLQVPGQGTSQASAMQSAGAPTKPPVIPNVTGKANSPVKKVIKNLADLRKLAAEQA